MDKAIQEFEDKFKKPTNPGCRNTCEYSLSTKQSVAKHPFDVEVPLITKKNQSTKSHGMANNSMTKGEYSKIEKENSSSIKFRTSGSRMRGSKIDRTECLGSKSDTHCSH